MEKRITYNSAGEKEYVRFKLNFRIQHIILMISTIMLIVTGLPLKFFTAGWAKFVMGVLGGTEGARQLHHFFAMWLIIIGIYHIVYSIVSKTGRTDFKTMIPAKQDIIDFWCQIKYFFSKTKTRPKFGRFSYIEKFDYWAVYWGFVIMIGSGIVMWMFQGKFNPWLFGEVNLLYFQGYIDSYVHAISRELHSDEALLATLAIIVWHFYNVHFNPDKFPGNKVWLTGKMSEEEMKKEHPLELEQIESRENKVEDRNNAEAKDINETISDKTNDNIIGHEDETKNMKGNNYTVKDSSDKK